MTDAVSLRTTLKRGALVAAANWPLVLIQFVAESTFKVLLAVPIVGGAMLVGLLVGSDAAPLGGDLRQMAAASAAALAAHPAALAAFLASFAVVLFGGAAFTFLLKGGTVAVLAEAEATGGPVERPPLRLQTLQRAARFSIERYLAGCAALFPRYLALGAGLLGVYVVTALVYVSILFGTYRLAGDAGALLGWSVLATLASSALIVWITLVNFFYLLTQMVIAVDNRRVGAAFRQVIRFVGGRLREVAALFGLVLALAIAATAVSVLAAGGLGLVAFVPLVGLAAFPLQLAAWLLRGVIFQYLGLTALGAYLTQYRHFLRESPPASWIRSA